MKIKYMMMTACAAMVLLTSCTDENDTDGGGTAAGGASFNISTVSASSSRTTRSVTGGSDNGTSDEWLKSYTLYVVDDNTKKVEKIFTRPAENTSLVRSETLKLDEENMLSPGTKTVYAIGNMTGTDAGISLSVGDAVDAATMEAMIYNATAGNGFLTDATNNRYIPMSNIVQINASATVKAYTIPLYRMFGKMTFKFTNGSASDITINSVSVSSVTKDNVFLFPEGHVNFTADRTDYLYAPVLPVNTTADDYTVAVGSTVAAAGTSDKSLYINESKADATTKHLAITVSASKNGNSEDKYTLTDFSYINRNDHDIIPITLTDYLFNPVVLYYPPIGGYPEARITSTDGKFYCTFADAGGDFVITPNIHKEGDDAPVSCSRVDVRIVSDTTPSLFATAPAYDTIDGTIKGVLGTSAGTAVLRLTFKVSESMTLVRNLYIVVE